MSNATYKETIRVEIDILRPNGEVETVDVSAKFHRLNDAAFANIKAATAKAGRGEILRYRNVETEATAEKTEADLMDDSYENIVSHMRAGEIA